MNAEAKFAITGQGVVEVKDSSKIGINVQIVFNKPGKLVIGDYCTIGSGVKIVLSGGDVSIGDWTSVHDNSLILSTEYVIIGQHCWFGQNSIIDGTGGLKIGNGVRVGMYSQIWSHVAAGEQIEGCTLFGERPVEIENDVWLVGSCIVASGVKIGRKTIALIGSNITKSWPEFSVIAGSPAMSKPNLNFYNEITIEEKWALISQWIKSAADDFALSVEIINADQLILTSTRFDGKLVFVKTKELFDRLMFDEEVTLCCIENKEYTKKLTQLEWVFLKHLSGNKARFTSK